MDSTYWISTKGHDSILTSKSSKTSKTRLVTLRILSKYDNTTATKHCTRTSIMMMKWDLATSESLIQKYE